MRKPEPPPTRIFEGEKETKESVLLCKQWKQRESVRKRMDAQSTEFGLMVRDGLDNRLKVLNILSRNLTLKGDSAGTFVYGKISNFLAVKEGRIGQEHLLFEVKWQPKLKPGFRRLSLEEFLQRREMYAKQISITDMFILF